MESFTTTFGINKYILSLMPNTDLIVWLDEFDYVYFPVCAVRVIAESDIVQDFLSTAEEDTVSFTFNHRKEKR